MNAIRWAPLLLISGSFLLAGCGPGSEPKDKALEGVEQKAHAEKQYPIKGKVVDVNPARPSVRLDHEEINGLMKGMEMEFDVEDRKVLGGLRPGDQVHGHLKVRGDKYVIVHLEKH